MDDGWKDNTEGNWSSGMIPVLGTGGPGFNSRIAPFLKTKHSSLISPFSLTYFDEELQ